MELLDLLMLGKESVKYRGIKTDNFHLMRKLSITPNVAGQRETFAYCEIPANDKPRILIQASIGIGTNQFTNLALPNFEIALKSDTEILLPYQILPSLVDGQDIFHNLSISPQIAYGVLSAGKPINVELRFRQNVQYVDFSITYLII